MGGIRPHWGQDRVQGHGWWTGCGTAARRLLATEDYQTSGALLKPQSSTAGAGNPVRQKPKVQTSLSRGFQRTWEMRNSGKHRASQVNSRLQKAETRSRGAAGGSVSGRRHPGGGGSYEGWEERSLALKEDKAVARFQRVFWIAEERNCWNQAAEMGVALWAVPDVKDLPAHLGPGHRAHWLC